MKILELAGQIQCKLDDGSMIVITTPPLAPFDRDLDIDKVRETLMGLGEDIMQARMRRGEGGIVQAHGGLGGMRLHGE